MVVILDERNNHHFNVIGRNVRKVTKRLFVKFFLFTILNILREKCIVVRNFSYDIGNNLCEFLSQKDI